MPELRSRRNRRGSAIQILCALVFLALLTCNVESLVVKHRCKKFLMNAYVKKCKTIDFQRRRREAVFVRKEDENSLQTDANDNSRPNTLESLNEAEETAIGHSAVPTDDNSLSSSEKQVDPEYDLTDYEIAEIMHDLYTRVKRDTKMSAEERKKRIKELAECCNTEDLCMSRSDIFHCAAHY